MEENTIPYASTVTLSVTFVCPNFTTRHVLVSEFMEKITIKKRPRSEAVITQRKFFKKTARGKVIKGEHTFSQSAFNLIVHQSFANGIFVTMLLAGSRTVLPATRL